MSWSICQIDQDSDVMKTLS